VEEIVAWLPSLMAGLLTTMWLAVRVLVAASVAGVVCGVALLHGPRPVRAFLRGYVDVVRGIPILVLLFFVFYGSGAFVSGFDATSAAAVALSAFAAAHITEIVRGGIGSLPRTTIEAAEMVGLTAVQRFRLVTVPLLLPRVVPPWVNTAVEIVKATSLASLIGVIDLMYATQSAVGTTFNPAPFYLLAAAAYFTIGMGLSHLGGVVERRHRYVEY
jgi:polar amino acid transport system permease protein